MTTDELQNSWARLHREGEFGNLPGVFSTELEWSFRGVLLPSRMLHVHAARQTPKVRRPIPMLDEVGLDVGQGRDIRIVKAAAGDFKPVEQADVLVEAEFPDQHPADWVQALAQEGRALLAIGPADYTEFRTRGEWTDTWKVALIPVMTYLSDSGVGIIP